MRYLQRHTSATQVTPDVPELVSIFYREENYHVEMVLHLPQPYFPPPVPQPAPHAKTVVDAVALAFMEMLPLSTRSVTITMQPHFQGSLASCESYFDGVWSTLLDYFERESDGASKGTTDLRRITILTGIPYCMVPEVRFGGFSLMLSSFEIDGICLSYDSAFRCQLNSVVASHLRFRNLRFKILGRLNRRLKMFIRYKKGSN